MTKEQATSFEHFNTEVKEILKNICIMKEATYLLPEDEKAIELKIALGRIEEKLENSRKNVSGLEKQELCNVLKDVSGKMIQVGFEMGQIDQNQQLFKYVRSLTDAFNTLIFELLH